MLVIDLHGMSKKRNIDICLGTNYENLSNEFYITNTFAKISRKNNLNKIRFDFPFSSPNRTIASFVKSECKVYGLQIEINSNLFKKLKSIRNLIKTLDEFIKKVKNYILLNNNLIELNEKEFKNIDQKLFENNYSQNVLENIINNCQVLFGVPDACPMLDDGVTFKNSESQAGAMAIMLAKNNLIDCSIKSKLTKYNFKEEYIKSTIKLIKNNKYNFYIELHVMNKLRRQDLVICCNKGKAIKGHLEILSQIISNFKIENIENISLEYPFNIYNNEKSIDKISKKMKIPSIQIIINQKLYDEKPNNIFRALQRIINMLS